MIRFSCRFLLLGILFVLITGKTLVADEKTHCTLFQSFDTAYKTLVSNTVKYLNQQIDEEHLSNSYRRWLEARLACRQIIIDAGRQEDLERLWIVDTAVKDAYDSLNGNSSDLLRYYNAYQNSSKNALALLCQPTRIKRFWETLLESVGWKLGVFGFEIDIKKILERTLSGQD